MVSCRAGLGILGVLMAGVAIASPREVAEAVRQAEIRFADTMARRDLAGFSALLAEEAVFIGRAVLRGRQEVAAGWAPLFEGEAAPFSWQPEVVEVLDSGTLALSSGPVFDPAGRRVGTFNSVWRLEADGQWRVVFDKGCPACPQAETDPGGPAQVE